jgi:hypothetical protein
MAEVLLIHGIAQEQSQADDLEAEWLPALAGGVRATGHTDLADRLWRHGPPAGGIDVRMAFYGDLFLPKDSQGADDDLGDLGPHQQEVADALVREWVTRAAKRDGHPDHDTAATELEYLEPGHEEQGAKEEFARALLNGAAKLRWFAPLGMAFAERFVVKSLRQVTLYLTDPTLRTQIQARAIAHLGPETRIIIGHSLGSVVAYEIAATHLTRPLPLLLTLGSPLGLHTIVYDQLTPQPPTYPARVTRWVNISDRDDLVAATPDLGPLFPHVPSGSALDCSWTLENGAKPHSARHYLTKRQVGNPIVDALEDKT